MSLSTIICILLSASVVLVAVSPHCSEESIFKQNFERELNGKSLKDAFEASNDVLGEGSFGVVKSIPWIDQNGNLITVAVKKVTSWYPKRNKILAQEIDTMIQFKGNQYIINFLGCMVITEKKMDIREINGDLRYTEMEVNTVYIVSEKLYADFSPKGLASEFKILPLLDRLEGYLSFAQGLKVMHDKHYIHGDIMPANIMATDSSLKHIKLIDLEAARQFGDSLRDATLFYRPKEYFSTAKAHPSIDIYSFGVSVAVMEFAIETFIYKVTPSTPKSEVPELISSAIKLYLPNKTGLKYSQTEENIVSIVLDCIKTEANERPTTDKLIVRLTKAIEVAKRGKNSSLLGPQKLEQQNSAVLETTDIEKRSSSSGVTSYVLI